MRGVLLNPTTGRPETPPLEPPFDKPGLLYSYLGNELDVDEELKGAPDHVKGSLYRAAEDAQFGPRASNQGWEELLYAPVADGATNTAGTEAVMVPDFNLPANYMTVGRTLKYTLFFRQSTAITTPGTITLRLRWGGVSGVVLAASGAWAPDPTAAATNLTCFVQYYLTCRSIGATGTIMCCGQWSGTDFDDASLAALVANLAMTTIPPSAPAVATVDTTIVKALSPTYTESVATASMTTHMAILESLN